MKKLTFSTIILFLILSLLVPTLVLITGCSGNLTEVKETRSMMSTFITITVYDSSQINAKNAVNAAFDEFARIEKLLNIYNASSEISALNSDKTITQFSKDFEENIAAAVIYCKLTNGSFDITVQPVLDLYTHTFKDENRSPTDNEIKDELTKVDCSKVSLNRNATITIGSNQTITLGGIAKGYAVDKAIEILKSYGIKHALVNAGGNMMALGDKGEGNEKEIDNSNKWSIALRNPRNETEYITLIHLKDKAVSTSGDYERYFDPEKKFHHIINPQTGYSATELISVTIIADNAFDADALSTSVFVLGKEKGMALIESLPDVEGLIITKDREIVKSSGFEAISSNNVLGTITT